MVILTRGYWALSHATSNCELCLVAKQNIIEKHTNKLASKFFTGRFNANADDISYALSKVYTQLTMKNILDLKENDAFDIRVDGKNDFAIEGFYFSELQNKFFYI